MRQLTVRDLSAICLHTPRTQLEPFVEPLNATFVEYAISTLARQAAFLAQYAGLLAERWYFFAEAKHPQNLYYQAIA